MNVSSDNSITNAMAAQVPYDRGELSVGIVHFGMGNFHRSHQANYLDQLLKADFDGTKNWAICGVGLMPGDKYMSQNLESQDGMYTLVEKYRDGHATFEVVGSVLDCIYAPEHQDEVLKLMAASTTKIVSLTVTEGGYNVDDETGEFLNDNPGAQHDAQNPHSPQTTFGYIVEALRLRKEAGVEPFTVMSCDNLPGNGDIARHSVTSQARLVDPEFAQWIDDNVSFPNGMVDRITPKTTDEDRALVKKETGWDDAAPVTSEPFIQWVLQDNFPAGRPAFEKVGVHMVDDVVPYEMMKLRLLNATHQVIAHLGRLMGLTMADEAAGDVDIAKFAKKYLQTEARPTLRPVPGIDLDEYIDSLFERFTNKSIKDTLDRLAEDASQRVPKFLLGSVRDTLDSGGEAPLAAAVSAAWAITLEGKAENGSTINISDKAWDEIAPAIEAQKAGTKDAFLKVQSIFGTLSDDPKFRRDYLAAFDALKSDGVRAVLEKLA